MAGIGVVSFIAFSGGSDRARVQADAAEIALFLQQARLRALETGQAVPVRIDAGKISANQTMLPLSDGMELAPSQARLTLRPSGENEGLELSVTRNGARADISVDWLTGRVTVQ